MKAVLAHLALAAIAARAPTLAPSPAINNTEPPLFGLPGLPSSQSIVYRPGGRADGTYNHGQHTHPRTLSLLI